MLRVTADADIMSSLVDVHAVETFDDAQVIQFVRHFGLDLLTDFFSDCSGFSTDEKVINLSEDEYQAMCSVVFKV